MFSLSALFHHEQAGATSTQVDAASHEAVQQELWTSFASILRAYLAAAEMHTVESAPKAQLTTTETQITINRTDRTLTLDLAKQHHTISDSAGCYQSGLFQLHHDGTVSWNCPTPTLELDAAAETITEYFFEAEREAEPESASEAAGEAGGAE